MVDTGKTNDYHDSAKALFDDLKLARYAMPALAVPTLYANAAAYTLAANNGDEKMVFRDLGGLREKQKFEFKLLAATNPTAYAQLKLDAYDEIQVSTEAAFKTAYERFMKTGYSRAEARNLAMQAAGNNMAVQQQAINMSFGEEGGHVFDRSLQHESSKSHNPVADTIIHQPPTHTAPKAIKFAAPKTKGHKGHKKRRKKVAASIELD